MLCAYELAFENFGFKIGYFKHLLGLAGKGYVGEIFHVANGRTLGGLFYSDSEFFK
jgi:hypothetical protein